MIRKRSPLVFVNRVLSVGASCTLDGDSTLVVFETRIRNNLDQNVACSGLDTRRLQRPMGIIWIRGDSQRRSLGLSKQGMKLQMESSAAYKGKR